MGIDDQSVHKVTASSIRRLNILLVPCTDWLAGSQQRLHRFAHEWSKYNQVYALYIKRPSTTGNKRRSAKSTDNLIEIPTIETTNLGSFYLFNSGIQLISIVQSIRKYHIDVIVVEGLGTSSLAILIGKLVNKPVIYDYCDYYPDFIPLYVRSGVLAFIFKSIGLISNVFNMNFSYATVSASRLLSENCKPHVKRIFEVSNGVSDSLLGLNAFSINSNEKCAELKLGFVGTLESWVSIDKVIDAVGKLNFVDKLNTSLWVIGDGPRLNYFKDYAFKQGLSKKVKFFGWIEYSKLHQYIREFDICILPFDESDISQYSMPLKIHEYSLFNKPTISSPLPEIVRLYGNSVLYASSTDEYVHKIKYLIQNKSFKLALAERAYNVARAHSWSFLAKEYEAILRGTLNKNGSLAKLTSFK